MHLQNRRLLAGGVHTRRQQIVRVDRGAERRNLPQAVGVTVPPLLGQAIVLVKDTALLLLISVMELTRCGQTLTSERFMPTEAFFTVAFFYLCLYFCLKTLADWSQKKLIFREVY